MRPDDAPRFAEIMHQLAATWDKPIDDARIEAYWSALDDLSIDAVAFAARMAQREESFFPKPATLRGYVRAEQKRLGHILHDATLRLTWFDPGSTDRRVAQRSYDQAKGQALAMQDDVTRRLGGHRG